MATVNNQFLDIGDIAFKSAQNLTSYFGFTDKVNRSYDDRFGRGGAKIGSVTQARLPGQFRFTYDTSSTAIDIQNLNDAAMPVTLNKNYQRSFAVDLVDMALSMDDFQMRYMEPALLSLAAEVDRDGLNTGLVYAENAVGTPGTAPNSLTTLQALFGQAYQKQVEHLSPEKEMIWVASQPALNTLGYTYMTQLFNPQAVVSNLQERGVIAVASNMNFHASQLQPNYKTGTYSGSPTVTSVSTTGYTSSTVVTGSWTSGSNLLPGATITFTGFNEVNPQTKQDLGYAKQFSVVSSVTSGTNQTITVSPAIIGPGDPRQNITAVPTSGTAVVVLGTTGSNSQMSLAYHKDAFIFATADIGPSNSGGGDFNGASGADWFTASLPELGISVYCSRQYDIRSRQVLMRLDLLGGWAPLYPQLATKIIHS